MMRLFRGAGTGPGGAKKPLSREEELQFNEQAGTIAASVLPEAVVAATRCEPAEKAESIPKYPSSAGAGTRRVDPRTRKGAIYMRTHGLPDSFILTATAGHVYVLEDKRDGGQLVAGTVLKTWDRSAVLVRVPAEQVAAQYQRQYGLPDDRQVILLWLPIDKDDPLPQAGEVGRGFPTQFIVARDVSSQRVIDALRPAPKGQFVYGTAVAGATAAPQQPSVAGATAAPSQLSVAQRLQELETLRAAGVISDAEYSAKRAQIIGEI
jgi:hypothetical protein